MKMTVWIPVPFLAHVPVRALLPCPKGINGLFLSAAGMASMRRMKRPGTGTGRVLGLGLSLFGLRKLSILDGG